MTTNNFYQITLTLSGKLLEFKMEDNKFNKYQTGVGKLLINDGKVAQIIRITAGQEVAESLLENLNKHIKITGYIRNYRQSNKKYNIVRVYSVTPATQSIDINEVNAECKLIGVMSKATTCDKSIELMQLYLLTNEKYNKHTRLSAIFFKSPAETINLSIGKIYKLNGHIQVNKINNEKETLKECLSTTAISGDLELIVNNIKEVTLNYGVKKCDS